MARFFCGQVKKKDSVTIYRKNMLYMCVCICIYIYMRNAVTMCEKYRVSLNTLNVGHVPKICSFRVNFCSQGVFPSRTML